MNRELARLGQCLLALEQKPKRQKVDKPLGTPPSVRAEAQRIVKEYGDGVGCSLCPGWRAGDGRGFEKHFLSMKHKHLKPKPIKPPLVENNEENSLPPS